MTLLNAYLQRMINIVKELEKFVPGKSDFS